MGQDYGPVAFTGRRTIARVTSIVIVGGGPGGYEAALVAAARLGAAVTVVDPDGLGGSACSLTVSRPKL